MKIKTNMVKFKNADGTWQDIAAIGDNAKGKQDILVSGVNIKTVNGSNILGSGDVEILANLPTSTSNSLGGVIVKEGLTVDDNGNVSVDETVYQKKSAPEVTTTDKTIVGAINELKATKMGNVALSTVATTGNYNDLINLPALFDGAYGNLTGLPSLFSGSYNDLSNKPTLFDGNYNSLSNLPVLFNGDYNSLSNKPSLDTYLNKGSLPSTIADAKKILDSVENTIGMPLDPNNLYVESVGEKSPDYVYMSSNPLIKGFFTPKETTSSVELDYEIWDVLSVKNNADKLENLSKTQAEFVCFGNYIDFSNVRSIKLRKNKYTFIVTTTILGLQSLGGSMVTSVNDSNIPLYEGTIVYDGEDSEYRYYHIGNYGSNIDNSILIIQSK